MRISAFALCFTLAACSDAAFRVEVGEQVAMGKVGYVGPVLARAESDFMGGAAFGGIGSGGPVTYDGGMAGSVALAVVRDDAVGETLMLRSRVYVEHSEVHTRLPRGIGVLTDPMQVAIWADGAGGEVMLGRTVVLPRGGRFDLAAGLGLAQIAARVHLQSALIDRPSHKVVTLPYVLLTGRYAPRRGPSVAGEIRLYDLGQSEFRLGFVQGF